MLGQRGIVQKLIAGFVIFFLESKCLIEDKAAHAGKLAHFAHLLAVRHEFKFKGLQSLHKLDFSLPPRNTQIQTSALRAMAAYAASAIHPPPERRCFSRIKRFAKCWCPRTTRS